MLEDDSGRVRLVGEMLKSVILVTGCIIAVMGTENANGEFEVIDLKFPDLPPQKERWQLSKPISANGTKKPKVKDEDVEMEDASGSSSKIAIVSGLDFSGTSASHAMELNLLLEYLLGEALDRAAQDGVSQISRLIIAGNSVSMESKPHKDDGEKKTHKKYGYDSSAYNAQPSQMLDDFLAELLESMPVTLLPGPRDPANASYPQQPVHTAMFPRARTFATAAPSKEPSWFDATTNPWEGEVDGWRVLGTGGQNVDDVFKYVDSDDRLGMMEAMCRWRCCAPTAPDTLCKFCSRLFFSLVGLLTGVCHRELSVSRRRPICHEDLPTSLLCWMPAGIWNDCYSRARGAVGTINNCAVVFQDARDSAGGHRDTRCDDGQDVRGLISSTAICIGIAGLGYYC
jgi:DNA polymerase delta subunit 2